MLKDSVPGKEQYWVTLDPELVEPDGEIQGLIPEWMQKAKQKGAFDSVELTEGTEEWKVSAGTPVGFMGCMESPGEGNNLLDKEWLVHLEVLSTDSNMPGFLANPEKVQGDKRSVLAAKEAPCLPGRMLRDSPCLQRHQRDWAHSAVSPGVSNACRG